MRGQAAFAQVGRRRAHEIGFSGSEQAYKLRREKERSEGKFWKRQHQVGPRSVRR